MVQRSNNPFAFQRPKQSIPRDDEKAVKLKVKSEPKIDEEKRRATELARNKTELD